MPLYRTYPDINTGANGEVLFTAPVVFESGVVFGNKYTSPILAANQNNYNIPDLKNYTIINFLSSVDINITGLVSSSLTDDFVFIIGNANARGGKKQTIVMNSASSLAANRFVGVANIQLNPGDFWWFKFNFSEQYFTVLAKI